MFSRKLRNGSLGAATAGGILALTAITPASAIVIGGVDVGTGPAVFEVASIYENVVTGIGSVLSGYGEVTQINGNNLFCSGGACELTYRFSGFVVSAISATEVVFTGGTVQFYVGFGADNDFNPFLSASSAADLVDATNGSLWLDLTARPNVFATDTLGAAVPGTLFGDGTAIGTGNDVGTGRGVFDTTPAILALAQAWFDTNSQPDNLGGFGDWTLTSSFGTAVVPHPSECTGTPPTGASCLAGSADLRGTVLVPEPMTLGLLGFGLMGLGVARHRSSKR